jgi:hypothetical protein
MSVSFQTHAHFFTFVLDIKIRFGMGPAREPKHTHTPAVATIPLGNLENPRRRDAGAEERLAFFPGGGQEGEPIRLIYFDSVG